MALAIGQCNGTYGYSLPPFTPFTSVPPQKMLPPGQWSCPVSPNGMLTPCGVMIPAGAMTLEGQPAKRYSNPSTAVPSETHSQDGVQSDEDDDGGEENFDEACAELSARIEAGGLARQAAIQTLIGNVPDLAFDASACRVLQKALEHGGDEEVVALGLELQGRVREAIRSPHANHVVQKLIEVLPVQSLGFITQEILAAGPAVARDRYGNRVLCQLIERNFGTVVAHMDDLIEELLAEVAELARHHFGHYVIEMILQTGGAHRRHQICAALCVDLMSNAKNRGATYVVCKALAFCDEEDRQTMVQELAGSPASLVSLVENQSGWHVVKALLKMEGVFFHEMISRIDAAAPQLQKNKYGRRLLEELKQIRAC